MNDERTENRSLPERLAERLGGSAGVRMLYGEPIERDGATVVPVARVRYGFGGGSGSSGKGDGGSGGGGGVQSAPVGYIEMRGGKTRFRRIGNTSANIGFLVLGGIVGFWGARRLFRRDEN